jgi:pimeloyl-ACP methyl ester carboxylesterase
MPLQLAFEATGSGSPVVILHGLFGSSRNWRGIARELAATHSVHCVDLRNHGASPWADSMGYIEMADDVLQLIARLRLDRPVVLGHSMGGKTAMAMALRQPSAVSRLVVVDIAPVPYADTLTPFAEAMRSADVGAAASRAEVERRLRDSAPDAGVVPFLMQNLVMRNDHFDWRLNLLAITAAMPQLSSFPSELLGARFAAPLTVVAGEASDYVAERDGAAFRPMFDDLEVDVVLGAGHWVHADRPAAFLACVRRALARSPRSTATTSH